VNEDNPGKSDRQTPILCLDFGDLRLLITVTFAHVVSVDFNVLEVLGVINHIQYKSLFEARQEITGARN
jgi:hypothetical protein